MPSINDILDDIGHASWNFAISLANGLIRFSDDILPFVPGVDSSLMKKSFNDYQQDLRMIKALKDLISHKEKIYEVLKIIVEYFVENIDYNKLIEIENRIKISNEKKNIL